MHVGGGGVGGGIVAGAERQGGVVVASCDSEGGVGEADVDLGPAFETQPVGADIQRCAATLPDDVGAVAERPAVGIAGGRLTS